MNKIMSITEFKKFCEKLNYTKIYYNSEQETSALVYDDLYINNIEIKCDNIRVGYEPFNCSVGYAVIWNENSKITFGNIYSVDVMETDGYTLAVLQGTQNKECKKYHILHFTTKKTAA